MTALASFRHGVHPPEHKQLTAGLAVRRMPYPAEVVLPVRQHLGRPALAVVRPGQRVERGDVVAEADGWVSVPVHASAAGTVTEVGLWPHVDGSQCEAVRVAVDPWSPQAPRPRLVPDWRGLSPREVVLAVRQAGVVGLGGAAFPTHVKLAPPDDVRIDTLVVNGCECEPYLTADHRTMVEWPERVMHGVRVLMHCLGVPRAVVGVELNKPDAVAALRRAVPADLAVEVLGLEVKYPQGAEKMLLAAVLGREVPSGRLPMHVGALVQNVGSVAAVAEVFETGLPLVERVVTVTGRGVVRPANLVVPVGVKLRDLLDACGGLTADAAEVVHGGPMMGTAVADLDAPVLKGTTGVVVLTRDDVRSAASEPCIRCGRCLDACPVFLNPQQLGALARVGRHTEMEERERLVDCMLCGSCAYVCPSKIPLAQLFAASKSALRKLKAAGP
jgi:Na+-translocating ferredoxin:NAD+ oxidoreductase subunit C